LLRTPLCDLLDIEYPILQGGMAWLGTFELASAVSNAGGLGIIGSGNAPGSWVREQIRRTRETTDRPFGVNIMLLSPYVQEVMEVVLEERPKVVTFGAGNPGAYIPRFKEAGVQVVPVVASASLARRLERAGADALVAEGTESGGHIGEITTMALVPQVAEAVDLSVVAAGGFADGRGLAAAMALGAHGVQIGTRFICAQECIAHPNYKKKIIEAVDRSTVVTGVTTGHPVRCLENRLTRLFAEREKAGAPPEELDKLGEDKLYLAAILGDVENGSVMAGQSAALVKDIKPAKDIVEGIVREAEEVIKRLAALPQPVSHV
jgi:enoyl-[acyl-carrier protein] reductase II